MGTAAAVAALTPKPRNIVKVAWVVLNARYTCKLDEPDCPDGADNTLDVFGMTFDADSLEVLSEPSILRSLDSTDFGLFRCGLGALDTTCGGTIISADVDPTHNKLFVLLRKRGVSGAISHFVYGFDLGCDAGGSDFPKPVKDAMSGVSKVMTSTSYKF